MGKTIIRRASRRGVLLVGQPRWRFLPPEIIHIIMGMLGTDRQTLSACALASREFTFPALCCLGRHIEINTALRLRECVSLLTKGSPFQHVRSLDLGITTRRVIHQKYWDDYLVILETFARRRTLTRLWLSEVPFYFSNRRKQERAKNVIISLAATVNELGLYSCHFSSYTEMISLIRSFPLCTSLYVRDCVARSSASNMFADLPQHSLHISDLELTSSPGNRFLADVSALVKDAVLDTSSLTGLSCHMSTADKARHVLMTAGASIERLQLMCEEAESSHVLADPVVTSWPLRSLTIGPLYQKDNRWCERALTLNPNVPYPYLGTVTILGYYKKPVGYCLRFWRRLDQILSREDMFPRLERLDICINVGSQKLKHPGRRSILQYLPTLREAQRVYFWGEKSAKTVYWPAY